eukprot:CAMPEP_0202841282 /NCGR_PEP_ID=MMETSP1389-20130828/58045_1 /ASSEMBLY_ACC=CAM_ASM_000865 /TAXON_ID=302021 /ORGANISM="Rhodomonas sp., Strain CCMP768" /LENGTH=30 /DNA_ID= /DNA_START= /DNA_END= /DNA_ORIENTATION=
MAKAARDECKMSWPSTPDASFGDDASVIEG